MLTVGTLKRGHNAGRSDKYLLNARWCGLMHDSVGALAQRAIRVPNTVRMDVGQLNCGAKEEKDREEAHKQSPSARVGCPHFLDPRHS
jgi:hypothetical protein